MCLCVSVCVCVWYLCVCVCVVFVWGKFDTWVYVYCVHEYFMCEVCFVCARARVCGGIDPPL